MADTFWLLLSNMQKSEHNGNRHGDQTNRLGETRGLYDEVQQNVLCKGQRRLLLQRLTERDRDG
ncbi:uncharacterized protein N7529_000927 [Penicillium soppii]|uniref:uncharacterized protein n=1 Tax=Penicillium soppii TaxID=69789 RepID=UPI0025485996|nr:uncharacterized protein N7529_000927 [Penicillium soppii]KAJ5882255.1 hypothetical protein N7529_000927 [Penicillium soppii]